MCLLLPLQTLTAPSTSRPRCRRKCILYIQRLISSVYPCFHYSSNVFKSRKEIPAAKVSRKIKNSEYHKPFLKIIWDWIVDHCYCRLIMPRATLACIAVQFPLHRAAFHRTTICRHKEARQCAMLVPDQGFVLARVFGLGYSLMFKHFRVSNSRYFPRSPSSLRVASTDVIRELM